MCSVLGSFSSPRGRDRHCHLRIRRWSGQGDLFIVTLGGLDEPGLAQTFGRLLHSLAEGDIVDRVVATHLPVVGADPISQSLEPGFHLFLDLPGRGERRRVAHRQVDNSAELAALSVRKVDRTGTQ